MPITQFQEIPHEVDFNVIMTFVEYYTELLKLVNFKLYSMSNFSYPPVVRPEFVNIGNEFVYMNISGGTMVPQGIFCGMRFCISPEVPLVPTSLVIISSGGALSALPNATHVIVDRDVKGTPKGPLLIYAIQKWIPRKTTFSLNMSLTVSTAASFYRYNSMPQESSYLTIFHHLW